MDFLKTVGGKIATGVVMLAVGAAGLAWYETDPAVKHAILAVIGHVIGWALLVAVMPWAIFAVVGWVARFDSNGSAGALVAVMTMVQATILAWLLGWSIGGPSAWTLFVAAVVIAGVYNLFACDWIAEKIS